jgi:hypothetical protein
MRKIIFVCALLLSACITDKSYHTYKQEGVPKLAPKARWEHSRNFTESSHWIWVKDNLDNDNEKMFDFELTEKGRLDGGTVPTFSMGRVDRTIYTEPYDLSMGFYVHGAQKIMVNKMIFKTSKKSIDLRQNVRINRFSEEELTDFRNAGVINIEKLSNEEREIKYISLRYDDIDVQFKKDWYFTVECDITFEHSAETSKTENYTFEVKFYRIRFHDPVLFQTEILIFIFFPWLLLMFK